MSKNINDKIKEYNEKMDKLPNDTVLSRWGMYTQDSRYKNDTASIVNEIQKDMKINNDSAYYMLYYMTSNGIDYKRAKEDMQVDKNFEMYKTGRRK